jgi:hypothetical protein
LTYNNLAKDRGVYEVRAVDGKPLIFQKIFSLPGQAQNRDYFLDHCRGLRRSGAPYWPMEASAQFSRLACCRPPESTPHLQVVGAWLRLGRQPPQQESGSLRGCSQQPTQVPLGQMTRRQPCPGHDGCFLRIDCLAAKQPAEAQVMTMAEHRPQHLQPVDQCCGPVREPSHVGPRRERDTPASSPRGDTDGSWLSPILTADGPGELANRAIKPILG